MKKRYIIGMVIIAAFIVVAVLSMEKNTIEYSDLDSAMKSGKTVQIIGTWMQSEPSGYNSEKDEFSFWLKDRLGKTAIVLHKGMKPNSFDTAPSIVVKGKFSDGVFLSTEVLTKCPSKYEGEL
jgi:cytochrome c-type biogenesis protein CcmE